MPAPRGVVGVSEATNRMAVNASVGIPASGCTHAAVSARSAGYHHGAAPETNAIPENATARRRMFAIPWGVVTMNDDKGSRSRRNAAGAAVPVRQPNPLRSPQ
jgi:hypothetical protein